MKIKLMSHSSVVVRASNLNILCDPWYVETAFNDGWALLPKPSFDYNELGEIDFLWISHEHPDHFHIPTLKAIKPHLKEDIVIVYQELFGDKVPKFLKKFGFHNIILLKHGKTEIIKKANVRLTIFQVGTMDSALLIQDEKHSVLINNDCELSDGDFRFISSYYSKLDLLMSQFSIAGFDGILDQKILKEKSSEKLDSLLIYSKTLKSRNFIPFASFIYFCSEDNKFLNEYSNDIEDVLNLFIKNKTKCTLLLPGESFDLNDTNLHDNVKRIEGFKEIRNQHNITFQKSKRVEIDEIISSFNAFVVDLKNKFPKLILNNLLKNFSVEILDLDKTYLFNFKENCAYEVAKDSADMSMNSQPLFYCFKFTWGIQTLGVSARYKIFDPSFIDNVWKYYRIITSLNNAEISTKNILRTLKLLFKRRKIIFKQFFHRIKIRFN
tara:strand:- start:1228 stop:2541 length:1314 start_codon:yes stop_codon:yes gene_type:complete